MYFHLKEYSSEEKCYVSIPYVPIQTGATATWHGSFATEHRDSEQLQSELHVEIAIQ